MVGCLFIRKDYLSQKMSIKNKFSLWSRRNWEKYNGSTSIFPCSSQQVYCCQFFKLHTNKSKSSYLYRYPIYIDLRCDNSNKVTSNFQTCILTYRYMELEYGWHVIPQHISLPSQGIKLLFWFHIYRIGNFFYRNNRLNEEKGLR